MLCLHSTYNLASPIGYYESKNSKFLAYIYSASHLGVYDSSLLDHFKVFKHSAIDKLRIEHKKAVHFVEAFRIMDNTNNIIDGCNDDGEPKGSSGPPMLEILRKEDIVNICCICVRYFGGTKLGVGGLVRAYTNALLDSIAILKDKHLLVPYEKLLTKTINIKLSTFNHLQYLASKYSIEIIEKIFLQDSTTLTLLGRQQDIHNLLQEI